MSGLIQTQNLNFLSKSGAFQESNSEIVKRLNHQKNEIVNKFLLTYIYTETQSLRPHIHVKLYSDAAKYEGEINNQGLKQGRGIYHYSNGDKYLGEWFNDLFNGKGVYIFSLGERYEGDLQNGKKQGKGVYFYANGNTYEGDWYELTLIF